MGDEEGGLKQIYSGSPWKVINVTISPAIYVPFNDAHESATAEQ